jgi:hypothetical protein
VVEVLNMVEQLGPGCKGLFANSACMLWFEQSEFSSTCWDSQ